MSDLQDKYDILSLKNKELELKTKKLVKAMRSSFCIMKNPEEHTRDELISIFSTALSAIERSLRDSDAVDRIQKIRLRNSAYFLNDKWLKRCSKCMVMFKAKKREGLAEYFDIISANIDGYMYMCRQCRVDFPEKRRLVTKDSIKVKARSKLRRALLAGVVKREPCTKCGLKAEAHHPDYSKPLDVVWLCKIHHKIEHARINNER